MQKKKKMTQLRKKEAIAGYLFFLPAILGLVLMTYGQMIFSFIISFTNWDVFGSRSFVGFRNYIELLTEDIYFWKSIKATLYYAFGSVLLSQGVALFLALMLNVKGIRGMVVFRTVFYLPSIVPAVASCLLWTWLFNPNYGLLNAALEAMHLPTSQWIYEEKTAVPSLILMSAWSCGTAMVVYLAGLQGVPRTLLEACEIDGGGVFAKFFHITFPMISPVLFYNVLMGIISGFMIFTNTYIMTEGGPNNSTLFVSYLIYRYAFEYNKMGYACALAWVVFAVLSVITVFIFRFFGGKVYYGGEE